MTQLVRYDAMVQAIAECHRVDEVKNLRDKALALEVYARQAQNRDAERQAFEVRIRAERRAGELLQQMAREGTRAAGGSSNLKKGKKSPESHATTPAPTLGELGITRDQSSKWQQLANVPAMEFEEALRKPTRAVNGSPRMDSGSLWVWGQLRDFERNKILSRSPADIYGGMTEGMQEDVQHILPRVLDWLHELQQELTR